MNQRQLKIARRHFDAMFQELIEDVGASGPVGVLRTDDSAGPKAAGADVPADALEQAARSSWELVEVREGETYSWPEGPDEYSSFAVYENDGLGQFAIGRVESGEREYWGRHRPYFVVFRLGAGGGSKHAISVFVAADDYDETREVVAVIRGAGGGRGQRMFDPAQELPGAYRHLPTGTFRDRIAGTPRFRGYDKQAVVAHEDDADTLLRHAAIQAAMRH
jgi:hypothetical protein